jgi:hypothetical protein
MAAGGNVGLKTGRGLLVVDLDRKNGNDGMAAWQDLCRRHGYDSPAPLVQTPSGGWHIYFSAPSSRRLVGHVGVLPGVDLRGDGNYVLVPPSRTEAGEYRYVDPGRTEAGPHPPAPAWLLEMARPGRRNGPKGPGKGAAIDLPAEVAPASPEEVEAALRALERRWPAMPWRAIWAGEEMTADRHGAVRTPSQRDQMLAYRLAAAGYSPEAIARLMTACPGVRAKRRGKQPDAWRRASYREATIRAAVELVQQHRTRPSGAEAPLGADAVDEALARLRTAPEWEIWAAQAQVVRRMAARNGQPSARITRRIMLDRLRAAGVEVSVGSYIRKWDARRNPLLMAAEDAAGYWWFSLREAEITETAGRVESTAATPAAPASASGRSGGRAGCTRPPRTGITRSLNTRVYSRTTPAPDGHGHAGKSARKSTVIARVEALLRQGKRPAEISDALGISRDAARNYVRRLRQRQAAEADAEAAQPEQPTEAVDVVWSLTPARRVLHSGYIPAGALADSRRREAWLRAADRIDAYVQAVQAPAAWERLPDFAPNADEALGPQEAAQEVIRVIGNWLRYTPPADWLPEHRHAIREWIAGEERRQQAVLDRMARKSGARRYRVHLSEALLIEKALEALDLRYPWLPGVWISRRDYRKTANDFQEFREGCAMALYLSAYELDPPTLEDLEAPDENQQQPEAPLSERRRRWSEFLASQTVPQHATVIWLTREEMDASDPPSVQPPGVLYIVSCPEATADFEEAECQPAK